MRRLRRLEAQFEPAKETEYSRRLRKRLEAGLRRVAEWREREGLPPRAEFTNDVPNGHRTIVEILNCGRQQNAMAHRALLEARDASPIAAEAGKEKS